jgi:hypothetical protein
LTVNRRHRAIRKRYTFSGCGNAECENRGAGDELVQLDVNYRIANYNRRSRRHCHRVTDAQFNAVDGRIDALDTRDNEVLHCRNPPFDNGRAHTDDPFD